jgi:hypothetical protein
MRNPTLLHSRVERPSQTRSNGTPSMDGSGHGHGNTSEVTQTVDPPLVSAAIDILPLLVGRTDAWERMLKPAVCAASLVVASSSDGAAE